MSVIMEKILVLAGGSGSEREVSVASGKRVAEALCSLGIMTALEDPIRDISPSEERFCSDIGEIMRISSLFDGSGCDAAKPLAPENRNIGKDSPYITDGVIALCRAADAVFIMLHGGMGESGRFQALFECLGIKYFGSSPEGSALAMDKLLTKRMLESTGVMTPPYTVYVKGQMRAPCPPRYPCVVKPSSEGSSVGVTPVRCPQELTQAVKVALNGGDTVLMEAMIRGRELTVGVLSDRAIAVTEIIPKGGFYDYESKYTAGKTLEMTPARISPELTHRAMRLAERVHAALGLSGFSRVDMIVEERTELIYVLEANTVPGMTETSLLPQAAAYAGMDIGELCKRMAGL